MTSTTMTGRMKILTRTMKINDEHPALKGRPVTVGVRRGTGAPHASGAGDLCTVVDFALAKTPPVLQDAVRAAGVALV